ncbi:translation initiation factor eIF3 subunit g [Nowakowskiella sp. JEL0078]|nr:translation initiation factor eIF3 subunit g [Nowakowskiella sp. JEL0078]
MEFQKLRKFGDSANQKPGPDTSTTTLGDQVYLKLSMGMKAQQQAEKEEKEKAGDPKPPSTLVCRICKGDHWTLKCPLKDQMGEPIAPVAGKDILGSKEKGSGKYILPSLRPDANGDMPADRGGRGAPGSRDDYNTIRITNLSQDSTEPDVRDLVNKFGNVARVFVARDRDTNTCKGYAFVSFHVRDAAEKAMNTLNGYGYDNLILKVEWASKVIIIKGICKATRDPQITLLTIDEERRTREPGMLFILATMLKQICRLQAQMEQDSEKYRLELLQSEPTFASRIAQMRSKMNELKQKREKERQELVNEKLLQRWRNECNELRGVESKRIEKEVASIRDKQIVELNWRKGEDLKEKQYYDELWEQDRLRKIKKEEEDKDRRDRLNLEARIKINEQLENLRNQAKIEQELKIREAELMRQDRATQALEEERNKLQKLHEQRQIRADLDTFNSIKLKQRAEDIKEALEMDLKMLSEFLKLDLIENEQKARKREDLKMKEEERVRELEIERLQKHESEKLWRIRAEKWQKEQKARDALMKHVLAGRQEQLKYAIEQNKLRLEQAQHEKLMAEHAIELAKRAEEVEHQKRSVIAGKYRDDLIYQVEMEDQRKKEEKLIHDSELQKIQV